MALPTGSALDAFTDEIVQSFKGYQDGRDGFPGAVVRDLFQSSLDTIAGKTEVEFTWSREFNHPPLTAAKVTINTTGTSQPNTVPVHTWHSQKEVVDAIKEFIEMEDEKDAAQERIDAYDRAMSVL